MNNDKVYMLRKTLSILTAMLIFATIGILLVSMELKTVTLNYYGSEKKIKTLSTTVESFLIQNNIYISDDMILSPSKDTVIKKDIEIIIDEKIKSPKVDILAMYFEYTPVVVRIEEISEEILFAEETINNPTLNRGITKVAKEGTNGEKVTKYFVKYEGDNQIIKAKLKSEVKLEPQNKVIEVGTKLTPFVSRANSVVIPIVDEGFKSYNIKLSVDQQKYAYSMCQNYGIQYELLLAVIRQESNYNPNAIGGGNSYGLCQIHISNFANLSKRLGISNLTDPYDNIKAGAYMLALYMNSAKNVSSDATTVEVYALNSYNMGEGAYFSICYSKGIVDRGYSTSVINLRNRLISNGGL